MSEQDDAGNAVTPLLPPPPPPPQPAARSASAAVRPTSAARKNLLDTLPPWSLTSPCLDRSARPARRGGKVSGQRQRDFKPDPATVAWPSRSGGTGRRAGLKIRWGKPRVGSSPTFGISTEATHAPYPDKQAVSRLTVGAACGVH